MRISRSLGSLGLAFGLAAASSGCIVVHDHDDDGAPPPIPSDVAYENIDAGQPLTTDPGSGVAIMLEYEGGRSWNLVTTCDTEKTGYSCAFDIYLRANQIRTLGDIELEGGDYIDEASDELHANFDTDYDVDGLTFETGDGNSVEVEVYLDGDAAEPFVFWVGDGQTHAGARTNPTVFIPN